MANLTTISLAVKAAASVLSDERSRKTFGWVTAAILSPFILLLVLISSLLSATADHNSKALDLCFNGGVISGSVPENYRVSIEDMRSSFIMLDGIIDTLNEDMEGGDTLDSVRVKSVFYSLYFGAKSPSQQEHRRFAECFVAYEERAPNLESDDSSTSKETRMVAVPIRELPVIFANIGSAMRMMISAENQANASEIYYRILYGGPAPTYGDEFDLWSDSLPLSSEPFIGSDGFCSPLGSGWRSMVSSEFGYRKDPFTKKIAGHGGIDLGAQQGTKIRAALPGTVYVVRYSISGYGYHIMIDHGGGFVTLYAHCFNIFVTEGQKVNAGSVIAEVGSTGRSTGPHLHFEVRINGEKQNPRNYLP